MHFVSIIGVFNTQIPKMEVFAKRLNDFRPLIIFTKTSILDVRQGFQYYSANVSLCFSFMILLKIIEIKGNITTVGNDLNFYSRLLSNLIENKNYLLTLF